MAIICRSCTCSYLRYGNSKAPFKFISRDLEVDLTTGTNESVRNGERVKVLATIYSSHRKIKTDYKWSIIEKTTRNDYMWNGDLKGNINVWEAENKYSDIQSQDYAKAYLQEIQLNDVAIGIRKFADSNFGIYQSAQYMHVRGAATKRYDYIGCLYPEGNISVEYSFLFNN